MVQFDQALVYKSTLDKVNQKIDNFKSINLDMSEFEKARDNIISSLETENVSIYQYSQNGSGLKQRDFFSQTYLKTISRLEGLYNNLESYDVYYKASSIFKLIRLFVNNGNKKAEEFEKIRSILVTTLKSLLFSDSLDYKVEGPIIEDLCDMTYLFIKEEITYFGKSETLEKIKDLDYYNNFLSTRVAKEIATLDANNPKYAKVFKIKNELDANGIINYANSDLISAITTSYITLDKKFDILSNLTQKIEEYNGKLTELQDNWKEKTTKLDDFNASCDETKESLLKKVRSVVTSIALATTLLISANILAKKFSKTTTYANTTTLYNPNAEEEYTFSKDYTTNTENKVILHEYTPYRFILEGNDFVYIRSDKQYDLTNIDEDLTFEEYLNLDLKTLGIKSDNKFEEKVYLDDKDKYEEVYKTIEKTVVDLNDLKIEDEHTAIWYYLLAGILYAIYKSITCYVNNDETYGKIFGKILKNDGENVKEIIEILTKIRWQKMSRKEYEDKIKELTEEMREVCDKCSDDIQKYEELFDYRDMLKDDRFDELNISSFLYDVKDKIELVRGLNKQK